MKCEIMSGFLSVGREANGKQFINGFRTSHQLYGLTSEKTGLSLLGTHQELRNDPHCRFRIQEIDKPYLGLEKYQRSHDRSEDFWHLDIPYEERDLIVCCSFTESVQGRYLGFEVFANLEVFSQIFQLTHLTIMAELPYMITINVPNHQYNENSSEPSSLDKLADTVLLVSDSLSFEVTRPPFIK